jgi:hypothetical protein
MIILCSIYADAIWIPNRKLNPSGRYVYKDMFAKGPASNICGGSDGQWIGCDEGFHLAARTAGQAGRAEGYYQPVPGQSTYQLRYIM